MLGEPNGAGCFKSTISHIKQELNLGEPDYVIGVTFGTDLDKWREILFGIFGEIFRKDAKFNKAFLLTDPIQIIDTNDKRDLFKDNLDYKICEVDGYLHTKFIILFYKHDDNNKFVIFISSKNISNSSSIDILIPFVSSKIKSESSNIVTAGSAISHYLDFLRMPADKYDYSWIADYDISPIYGGDVKKIEIAYGKGDSRKRFSEDLWKDVLSCNRIISPFVDNETVCKVVADKTFILSYPDRIQKVINESKNSNDSSKISWYMGRIVDRNNMIYQERFHSKVYTRYDLERDKTVFVFGSANLTWEAQNKHCEILVELELEGDSLYKEIDKIFKEYAIPYNEGPVPDNDEINEDEPNSKSLEKDAKIYVERLNDGYRLHVIKKQNGKDISWGEPYPNAVYYVIYGNNMIFIRTDNYLEPAEFEKYNSDGKDIMTYEEYAKHVTEYLKKFVSENDASVLRGRRGKLSPSQGTLSKKGSRDISTVSEQTPCLYNTLYSIIAARNDAEFISKEELKEALLDLRSMLCNEKYTSYIDEMIVRL